MGMNIFFLNSRLGPNIIRSMCTENLPSCFSGRRSNSKNDVLNKCTTNSGGCHMVFHTSLIFKAQTLITPIILISKKLL